MSEYQWRETNLSEDQQKRLSQVERYHEKFGYADDSDLYMLFVLATRLDTIEWMKNRELEKQSRYKKWIREQLTKTNGKPYTCTFFRRIEYLLYKMRGLSPFWNDDGRLISGNVELKPLFPGWAYEQAAKIQNKWPLTRIVLSM